MGTTDNMTEKEMTEEIKESRMTVRMTKEALYDFLLFHAYSKFSGFLVNILGDRKSTRLNSSHIL